MPAPSFPDRLRDERVALENILLDPNNPRMASVSFESIPEGRIGEDGVQAGTLRKLSEGAYDLDGMRGSLRRSGLLTIDRIVVRQQIGTGRYVVVEGNRRIAAAKILLQQHRSGEINLEPRVVASLENPSVLVLDDQDAENAKLDQWVIQGVRHIIGLRQWGAYQSARTMQAMILQLGYSEREVVDALGTNVSRVRRSLRVLAALEQMQEDEEFGDYANPELYVYFDEAIRRVSFRTGLGWNEATSSFTNDDRIHMFYSWITPDEDLDGQPRMQRAEDIRNIDHVMQNDAALALLNTPGQTFAEALAISAPAPAPEWRSPIERATKALKGIPTDVLENLANDDRELITDLRDTAERRLQIADQIHIRQE
jgi:hypothetical protein